MSFLDFCLPCSLYCAKSLLLCNLSLSIFGGFIGLYLF
ncbi:putative membrane protein [Helicobacter pylori Hp H-36]|nr:putative membrane protein [Helicobacter pylori Hp H-36]